MRPLTLFDDARLTFEAAIELTAQSLCTYGPAARHWVITYSGGKDSSTTLTLVHHLIETGRVPAPETLNVLYADTRLELPPLHATAMSILQDMAQRGVRVKVVAPAMDHRFFVYMLGRGVPPPGARFRWCTGAMKIEPMQQAIATMKAELGELLIITGVRIGESAARDQRIVMSCSREGSECGQGYYQRDIRGSAMLAPIAHWRVCHVWDWLGLHAPGYGYGTDLIAEAYGGDEAQEINARTGCIGCPVASRDLALETLIKNPRWGYLAPLLELRALWPALRHPRNRLRKTGERNADGSLRKGGNRLGPLTMQARQWGLERVLDIQGRVNDGRGAMPAVSLVDAEEEARIRELWAMNVWPQRWDGTEMQGDVPFVPVLETERGHAYLFGVPKGGKPLREVRYAKRRA